MSLSPSQPFDSPDRTDAPYRRRCGAGFWIIAGMWLAACLGCGSRSEPATEYGESETWAHWQDFLDADEGQPQGPVVTDQSPSEFYPHGSVVSQACAECHAEQAKSFAATPHARSSRPIGESDLEQTASFQHAPSLRRYEVDLVDGQMLHREAILAPDGGTIATDVAHPELEIGSGIHAHSYLLRRDGYWIQSPLTWY